MNGRRIGLAVTLAACVIGGLTGGVATGGEKPVMTRTNAEREARAHNEEFKSTITIREAAPGIYKGRVISDSDDCVKNRRVTILAREGGSDAVFVVGHDRTDKKGRWIYQAIGEGYFAEVKEKVVERGDHKHTCLFDRSPTTPFRR